MKKKIKTFSDERNLKCLLAKKFKRLAKRSSIKKETVQEGILERDEENMVSRRIYR